MKIQRYRLHRVHLKLPLPIGDSQVRFQDHWMVVLEIDTDDGQTGIGFELDQGIPKPSLEVMTDQFEYAVWPGLRDCNPFSTALKITRPRGGNVGASPFSLAVETALWDLMGKSLEMPLYRLLGGSSPQVRAYGSTLDFRLSGDQFRDKLSRFRGMGFRAIKIKVGHPDIEWDLARMRLAREVMGKDSDLMVDANEAFSPKEAILRLHRYHEEGIPLYWVEDPITRDDYEGYSLLCAQVPFTRINTGEYLGFSGKRRLLEAGAVDVLNVHGSIGGSRAAAQLAGDFGIPVSLGNTNLEIGVHLAASLPECLYMEFSDLMWNDLAKEPVHFVHGRAIAPDRPGHGIELDREALERYSVP